MPKGQLKNFEDIEIVCQWCGKSFSYHRTSSSIRKACYDCIPDGQGANLPLLRRLIKKKAVAYKGGKCEKCGQTYEDYIYDFHHNTPSEKDFSLGSKQSTTKWDLIQLELDNCSLLCANCHREEHYKND